LKTVFFLNPIWRSFSLKSKKSRPHLDVERGWSGANEHLTHQNSNINIEYTICPSNTATNPNLSGPALRRPSCQLLRYQRDTIHIVFVNDETLLLFCWVKCSIAPLQPRSTSRCGRLFLDWVKGCVTDVSKCSVQKLRHLTVT
jgi:hypothetical protein